MSRVDAPARPSAASPLGRRRWPRWLGRVLALLLLPKCAVCLLGYVALATGLGALGREFCGVQAGAGLFAFSGVDAWIYASTAALGLLYLALRARRRRLPWPPRATRCHQPPPAPPSAVDRKNVSPVTFFCTGGRAAACHCAGGLSTSTEAPGGIS